MKGERVEGVTVSSANHETAHVELSRASERFTERNPQFLPIQGLRKGREQHVPESSNHSLYPMKLLRGTAEGISTHNTHIRTNTNSPTHPPTDPPNTTPLSSLPSSSPSPSHTHTQTHMYMHVYLCMCVYMHMYMCMCMYMYMFSTFHHGFMSFCYISYIYIHLTYIYTCYHQSSRKPQHSKWNCVGTNMPRHIHMNTPKIRILQKKIHATTKFEFESAN